VDDVSSSDELQNEENGAVDEDVKVTKSSVIVRSDGSSDDLFVVKSSQRLSFLHVNEDREKDDLVLSYVAEKCALFDNLEHNDSGLDPDDNEDWQPAEDMLRVGDDASKFAGNSADEESGETRKFFNPPAANVELCKSTAVNADVSNAAVTAGVLSSSCESCSSRLPVTSVLADLLEEENNNSSGFSDVACCGDCEEIVQLLPSLASVSDIIFSDTEDSLDSEPALSDASVFSSPEPCGEELATLEPDQSGSGPLTVLDSAFDHLFHVEVNSDLCSTAQCYVGSFLAPVYTVDGSSLWFRDSHCLSASVDALGCFRSDWPPSTGWLPSPSVPHESVCTAMAQCRRLLPSENTAFCDNIPQRLQPLVNLPPVACEPLLANNIVRQSSECALSPWLWPASVDESLSLKVLPSRHQFRPIGTPSTTDSELSEVSNATAEATSTVDSLTDFTALVMSDVLANSHETYQRFVISSEYDVEGGDDEGGGGGRTFRPSFRVQCELEKAAQTGEPSPPIAVASDVDVRLGCLVKQVLSQLSGEFPEASSSVDEILCDSAVAAGDVSGCEEQNVDEASVTMSRQLSFIWDDAAVVPAAPAVSSDQSVVSCHVAQIWTDSATAVTNTGSPSFVATHGRQLSDIWSDTTTQLADSAYVSDSTELLPSGVPNIWKDVGQRTQTKTSRLHRMWKSVDSDDSGALSSGRLFNQQSIWSHSRPSSVTAEVETLRPVLEDGDIVTCGCDPKSSSTEELSDQCSVSPSELDNLWGPASDERSPSSDTDAEACADRSIFDAGGLRNSLLGSDDIWSHNETDICTVESGAAEVKRLWNVDPLYCSGNDTSSSFSVSDGSVIRPNFDDDPPPFWISSETSLDASVAFAFTHLVSGVVRALLFSSTMCFQLA